MNRILIVPFFIPHQGCPFSCAFCNQWKITGSPDQAEQDVAAKVKTALRTVKIQPETVEAAFYGGSFTGLPEAEQLFWLEQAFFLKQQGLLTGIRLSTRPDYISAEILERLLRHGVTTIELGVQSLDDEVLAKSLRGHTAQDTVAATALIRKYPFHLIYQLMLGLPGDTPVKARLTARKTILAKPDGVRIYPAVVLSGTALDLWYKQGLYRPWTLQEAVETSADLLGMFSLYSIPVIRLGLQATESLATDGEAPAGPWHPAFGELAESALMFRQTQALLQRLCSSGNSVTLCFHPADTSKVIGQHRQNQIALQQLYPYLEMRFLPDQTMSKNDLKLNSTEQTISLSRQEFLEIYRIEEEGH
ncbi:MAG: radical SAM protein [Clostridia bacterium]|jgi:histone acetyltransferase (RNA polymerase elongator complex component)|nr:radical SAM protein [Clostridia bacterium]